jgi:predicted CoA-binding protein
MIDDVAGLRRILMRNRSLAVVGLSAHWHRPSHFAAKYMLDHGYTVVPVNPAYPEVLGQKCYPSLRELPFKVDIVDCFRRAEDIPAIVEDAIAIGAKVLWLQIGVIHDEAARRAEAAGLGRGRSRWPRGPAAG